MENGREIGFACTLCTGKRFDGFSAPNEPVVLFVYPVFGRKLANVAFGLHGSVPLAKWEAFSGNCAFLCGGFHSAFGNLPANRAFFLLVIPRRRIYLQWCSFPGYLDQLPYRNIGAYAAGNRRGDWIGTGLAKRAICCFSSCFGADGCHFYPVFLVVLGLPVVLRAPRIYGVPRNHSFPADVFPYFSQKSPGNHLFISNSGDLPIHQDVPKDHKPVFRSKIYRRNLLEKPF
ncbi:hypothetical protein D3C86_1531970 [compost metagenome]